MADTDFKMSREERQSCSRHGLHQLLLRYWMLFAVLATAGIAVAYPNPGVQLYTHVSVALLVALFFFQGFMLKLENLRQALALRALPAHLWLQTFSLVVTPLLYFAIVYRWKWEVTTGILSNQELANGALVALAMPTTTSTSLLFTLEAGGDVSFAALHCCVGQILGVLVAPLLSSCLLQSESSASVGDLLSHVQSWDSKLRFL